MSSYIELEQACCQASPLVKSGCKSVKQWPAARALQPNRGETLALEMKHLFHLFHPVCNPDRYIHIDRIGGVPSQVSQPSIERRVNYMNSRCDIHVSNPHP